MTTDDRDARIRAKLAKRRAEIEQTSGRKVTIVTRSPEVSLGEIKIERTER